MTNQFFATVTDAETQTSRTTPVEANNPENALQETIKTLPEGWVGGIEIDDEESFKPDEMPLLDYWKDNPTDIG